MKQILFYTLAGIFVLTGMFSIVSNFKKESPKEKIDRINYVPIKNYGKPFLLVFGLFLIVLGIVILLAI